MQPQAHAALRAALPTCLLLDYAAGVLSGHGKGGEMAAAHGAAPTTQQLGFGKMAYKASCSDNPLGSERRLIKSVWETKPTYRWEVNSEVYFSFPVRIAARHSCRDVDSSNILQGTPDLQWRGLLATPREDEKFSDSRSNCEAACYCVQVAEESAARCCIKEA
jgi:hypothetical protein